MPADIWQPSFCRLGIWYWHAAELPNGWTPQVCDDSQASAPKRPTRYTASAVCRWWIVQWTAHFNTLAAAKVAALTLAGMQKEASADPSCRVEVSR